MHAEILRFASKPTMFPKHEVFEVVVMKTRKKIEWKKPP
jgi:hypothetical protein